LTQLSKLKRYLSTSRCDPYSGCKFNLEKAFLFLGSNFSIKFSGVHVTLESLLDDKDIQATIKGLVTSSGRSFPGKKVEGADESGEKLSKVQLNGKA